MKARLFIVCLFFLLHVLKAQDTIHTLIISEARIDNQHEAYVELTNVSTTTINLSQFEFGKIDPWTKPYQAKTGDWFMLPNKLLMPGRSFVMAKVNDWVTRMWIKNPEAYNRYESKPEFLRLADLQIHVQESPVQVTQSIDSVSTYAGVVGIWNGSYCWYLRHHVAPGDSVVVDQVGGVFNDADGTGLDVMHDVAGYSNATGNGVLVRKASVKQGNINFLISSGTNADESEWIVVPFLKGSWETDRAVFWTVGNHGNYRFNSLQSSILKFNIDTTTLTVPWGIRNDDSIMYQFNRVPGIAWHYDYAGTRTDSAYVSVRTGDKLTIYACGNKLEKKVLHIIATDPKATDNIVIPMKVPNRKGFYNEAVAFCEVTDKVAGMDTIRSIPFACRKDSLMKYLEKPAKATWNFVLLNGESRADLIKGDLLAVTSENGVTKQYYIKPNRYNPSHDASLSAITWPDIPESLRGKKGWKGDTIPGFNYSKTYYKVSVPYNVYGIPALIGKTRQINASIQVKRALNIEGNSFERTMIFTVTAEDDTTVKTYMVEFCTEKGPCCIQPWKGEPFISEFVFRQDYQNYFCEIVNPSNSYNLDLSNYMLTFGYYPNANEAITRMSAADSLSFANRYNKYIPGFKWDAKVNWYVAPAIAIPDPITNPIVSPGDVFVMADVFSSPTSLGYPDFTIPQIDIDFQHNFWGDDLGKYGQTMNQWWGMKIMLFKILNDSVKRGIKPANDPKDFRLIDVFGDNDGNRWIIGGDPANATTAWIRKPEIYKGNPVIQRSFGTNPINSEWIKKDEVIESAFLPFPDYRKRVSDGIGNHYMAEVTIYKSTITSPAYKISEGFSNNENIKGVTPGITVNNFYLNIVKVDPDQHLKIKKAFNGQILTDYEIISEGDTLIVVSADSVNTTKYVLDFTPLSNNATLTSAYFAITTNGNLGTISNFDKNTYLKAVLEGVVCPLNATIEVIDEQGAYVPMKILNYDTVYQYVKVNNRIKFEVTAEDRTTKIIYHLQPNTSDSDAFVTSDVYEVDEITQMIRRIPDGTSVDRFYANLIPTPGATMKILDKMGVERKSGILYKDDVLIVTSANGTTNRSYYFTCLALKILYLVTSKVYHVDGILHTISGNFSENTRVDTFLSHLIYAPQGTIKLYDSQGKVKLPTDFLAKGDLVIASISNYCMRQQLTYSLSFATSYAIKNQQDRINLYPNPTAEVVYVSGLMPGNRIRVYNYLGELIFDKVAKETLETIVIHDQPKGVYFIKIINYDKHEIIKKMLVY